MDFQPPKWLPEQDVSEPKYELVMFSGDEAATDVPILGLGSGHNDPGQFVFWSKMRGQMMGTLGLGSTPPPTAGLSNSKVVSVEIPTLVSYNDDGGFKGIITSALRGSDLSPMYSDPQLETMGVAVPEKRKPKELRTDVIPKLQRFNQLFIEASYKQLKLNYYVEPATGNKVPIWDKAGQGIVEIFNVLPIFDAAYLAWVKEGGFEHSPNIPAKAGTSELLRSRMIGNFKSLLNFREIVGDQEQKNWYAQKFVKEFLDKLKTMPREELDTNRNELIDKLSGWGFIPEFLSDNIYPILDFYEPGKTAIDAREEVCSEWIEGLQKNSGEMLTKAIELVNKQGIGYMLSQIDGFELIELFDKREKLMEYVDNIVVYPRLREMFPFHILANPNIKDPSTDYSSKLKELVNELLWQNDIGGRLYSSMENFTLHKYTQKLVKNFLEGFRHIGIDLSGLSLMYKVAPELVNFVAGQSFQPNQRQQFDEILGRLKDQKADELLFTSATKSVLAFGHMREAAADTIVSIYTDLPESPEGPLKQTASQFDRTVSRVDGTYLLIKALNAFGSHKWGIDFSNRPLSKWDFLTNPMLAVEKGFVYNLNGKDYAIRVNADREELGQLYLDKLNKEEMLPLLGQIYGFYSQAGKNIRKLEGLVGKLSKGLAGTDQFQALKDELKFKFSGGNSSFDELADKVYKPMTDYVDSILALPSKTETEEETQARVGKYLENLGSRWEGLTEELEEISGNDEKKAIGDVAKVVAGRAGKKKGGLRSMIKSRMEKYGSMEGEVYQNLAKFLEQWDKEYEPLVSFEGLEEKLAAWGEPHRGFWYSIYEGIKGLKEQLRNYRETRVKDFLAAFDSGTELDGFGFGDATKSVVKFYKLGDMNFLESQITNPAILGKLIQQPEFFKSTIRTKINGVVDEVWGEMKKKMDEYMDSTNYPRELNESVSKIITNHNGSGYYVEKANELLKWMDKQAESMKKNVAKWNKLIPEFKQNLTKKYDDMYENVKKWVDKELSGFFNNGGRGVSDARYPGFPIYSSYSPNPVPEWFKLQIGGWFGPGMENIDIKSAMDSALKGIAYPERDIPKHIIGQFEKLKAAYLKPSYKYEMNDGELMVDEVQQEFKSNLLDPAYIRVGKAENGYAVFCRLPEAGAAADLSSYFSILASNNISSFLNYSLEQVETAIDLTSLNVRSEYLKTMNMITSGLGGA